MKKILLFTILMHSISSFAQKTEDRNAIKGMCGCFEVSFKFAETFSYPINKKKYKKSAVKQDYALEWVQLVEDTTDKISIQHLLIVGKEMIIKHWRQDWLFQNTAIYDYSAFNIWEFIKLSEDKVKGQWTQQVFDVDDKPRYQGSSSWVHIDGRQFWENTTNAPLPRREYTLRDDYRILRRRNVHEITQNGWIHDQDNDKLIKETNGDLYLLAQEKGHNIYNRVSDSKCLVAQNWWKIHQGFWAKVRLKWNQEFAKNNKIQLAEKIDEKPLYSYLNAMKIDTSQEEINQIINKFLISETN